MSMAMNTRGAATPLAHGRHDLIGSDRVEGTNVYRSDGKKIGEIERVMIDKISGQAAYAVMGFGGFLGMGEDHYPIPWERLTYNEKLGGYEINLTDEQLKNAPHYATGEEWKWDPAKGPRHLRLLRRHAILADDVSPGRKSKYRRHGRA